MRTRRLLFLSSSMTAAVALSGAALARSPRAAAPAAARAEAPDFVRDVQPILASSCIRCHGPAKQKGKLRLDTREGMLAGGEYGPVLLPGAPVLSPVFTNLVERDPVHRMPHETDPLPAAEIETIRRWIEAGAPWPAGVVVADTSQPTAAAPTRPRGPRP